jgi:lysozyme
MRLSHFPNRFTSLRKQLGQIGTTARVLVATLSLSAGGLIGIVAQESYTDRAVIPTKGDRPTVGFGSTFHEDGRPVRLGDTTTPVRALITAKAHIGKDEEIFRRSLEGASLSQAEFDLYLDFVYEFGPGNWQTSAMRRKILSQDYVGACNALLAFKKSAGYDCSTSGNRICYGVWTRQLKRHKNCLEAAQ